MIVWVLFKNLLPIVIIKLEQSQKRAEMPLQKLKSIPKDKALGHHMIAGLNVSVASLKVYVILDQNEAHEYFRYLHEKLFLH